MSLIPVFFSLGRSSLLASFLPRFNELLTRLSVEREVPAEEARNLLAEGLGIDRSTALIAELYGDSDLNQTSLFRLWDKVFALEHATDGIDRLGSRLGEIPAEARSELVLPLIGVGVEATDPPSGRIDLLLAANAQIELAVKAGATLPGSSSADADLVRVGLSGTIGGLTSLGFSMQPVSGDAQLGARYAHRIEYFLRGAEDRTLAQEAMRGLELIATNPALKVRTLLGLLTNPGNRVEAIRIVSNQAWRFGGKIALARQLALPGQTGLGVGVEVGFHLIEQGEYEYALAAAPNGLEVAIRRLDRVESTTHESIGVELELNGLARKLYPKIRDQLGTAGDALQQLLELLPDKDILRSTLTRHIEEALAGFAHKDLLISAIGLDPAISVDARIAAKLSDLIERAPMLWQGKTDEAADAIIDHVLGRIGPLTPDTRSELKNGLHDRVRLALGDLDKEIKDKVQEIVLGSELRSLTQALHTLGDDLSSRITSRDGKIGAIATKVRTHVGRYQAFISKLGGCLESAAVRRVTLKLGNEVKRIRSEEAAIRLRFNPNAPEADEFFRRLLLSDVETVFREAIKGDGSGPVIALNVATLTRYASLTKTRSFDAVLFGFEMGSKSILEAETSIVEDAAGNLTIASKMSYQQILTSLFDKRRFQIINAYQLANSGQGGSVTVAFSAYREANGLKLDDIKEFTWACERMGMVSRAHYDALDGLVARATDLDFKRSRLNVGLTLSEAQLAQLIGYGAPVSEATEIPSAVACICLDTVGSDNGFASEDGEESPFGFPTRPRNVPAERPRLPIPRRMSDVVAIACRAFDLTLQYVEPSEPDRSLLERLFKETNYSGTVGDAIRDFPTISFATDSDLFSFGGPLDRARDWLSYRHKAVTELARKGLLGMWAIYHSGPARWPVERYERCQERIGEIVGYWFDRAGSQLWAFGIQKEMRPVTLALLRTLLDLADTDPWAPGPLVAMDLQLLDDDARVLKTLAISD